MNEFKFFGLSHIVIIILAFLLTGLSYVLATKLYNTTKGKILRYFLATLMALGMLYYQYFYYFVLQSWSIQWQLPIHVCSIVQLVIILELIQSRKFTYNLIYFWGVGAILIVFLNPNLKYDFPNPLFMDFWISHLAIVVGVSFILFGSKNNAQPHEKINISAQTSDSELKVLEHTKSSKVFLPNKITYSGMWTSILALLAYAAVVYPINYYTNSNYGFINQMPKESNFLSFLGEDFSQAPLHLLIIGLMLVALFHLLYYLQTLNFLNYEFLQTKKLNRKNS